MSEAGKAANGEVYLAQGTSLNDSITDIGIFYDELHTPQFYDSKAPSYTVWGYQYLELYQNLVADGMVIDLNTRGGKFTSELKNLYDKYNPVIPEYMATRNNSYHDFYKQNAEFLGKLAKLLFEHQ